MITHIMWLFSFLAAAGVRWCLHVPDILRKTPFPAFGTDVSTKLFFCWNASSLWATTLKEIFPSTFRKLIDWLMVEGFFSLGIRIPPALCHAFGMIGFFHATAISFQRYFRTPRVPEVLTAYMECHWAQGLRLISPTLLCPSDAVVDGLVACQLGW